jgi:hypothetical protein
MVYLFTVLKNGWIFPWRTVRLLVISIDGKSMYNPQYSPEVVEHQPGARYEKQGTAAGGGTRKGSSSRHPLKIECGGGALRGDGRKGGSEPPGKITTSIFVSLATEISIGWFQLTGCWRLPSKQTWQNLFRRFCLRKILENNRSKWVTFHCHVWLPEGSDYTWRATDTWRTWSWMFMLLGDTWCRRLVAWNGSYMVHIFKNMFSSEIMWIETKTNTQVLLGLDSLLIYLLCTFS